MIRAIGFDTSAGQMEVEFVAPEGKEPTVYLVQEVLPTGELAMLHSSMMVPDASIGRIYNSRIKSNPNFVVVKLEVEAA